MKTGDNPPTCFPEDLFGISVTDDRPWWVARTKSRQEKALAWSLKGMGLNYFLPLVNRPQKCRKRLRLSIVPLFCGYLFFKGDQQQRYEALKTGRIAQVLEVANQEKLIFELSRIHSAATRQQNLELCDFVSKGKKMRIIDGPFQGLEGIVKQRKNKTRLILQVQIIRQAASVEIDINQAQAIN